MALHYQFWSTGYAAFMANGQMIQPSQCFEISGEQKEIHAYLEDLSKMRINDVSFIYHIQSGSNQNEIVGFTDANVSLYFCIDDFESMSQAAFEAVYFTPYRVKHF
jgi:hypothetical protein